MSNFKKKEVMDYLTRKPVTSKDFQAAIDISKLRSQTLPQATSIEQPETDYQTEVQPDMVVPPQDVLPKGAEPVMPFAPGIPDPQYRQLELASGGAVNRKNFVKGSEPEDLGSYIFKRKLLNGDIRYRVAFEGKETLFKDKDEAIKYRDQLVSERQTLKQKQLGDKKFLDLETFTKLFNEQKVSDASFAEFLNKNNYVNSKGKPFTEDAVSTTRLRNNIPSFIQQQRIENVSEEGILKRASEIDALNPNTGKLEKGELLRQYKAGILPSLDDLLYKVQQREGTAARTQRAKEDPEFRKKMSERQKKSTEKMRSTPEGLERLREIQRKYRAKVATELGAPPPPKDNPERFWLDLYQTAFRAEKGGIDSAVKFADYAPKKYPSMNIIKGTTLIDSKTGEKLTFKNIKDFIDTNKPGGMDYDKILNEYEKKVFFQQNQDLKDFFGEKMSLNYERGSRYNPANIHHPYGRFNNPYNVQFTFFPENKKEASLRKVFDTDFNQAETLSDKKKVFKNYINQLEGLGIESGFNQKLYGERPTLEEQMTREGFDVSKDPRAEQIRKLKFEALEPGSPLRKTVGYFPGSAIPLTLFDAITLPLAGYSIPETATIAAQNFLKNPYVAGAANIATQMYDIQKGGSDEMISKANERRQVLEQGVSNFMDKLTGKTIDNNLPSYSEGEVQMKTGGRVQLKNGTEDMYLQEIPSLGLTDPIDILEQQLANEKDTQKILALSYILDETKKRKLQEETKAAEYKKSQKEKGIRYMEDFPSQTDYFVETGKQLLTNPKYFYGKGLKGVTEGTEWLVGQPLQILFNQEGKNFEWYQPKAGEKLGINKFIEENIPKGATTGTLALGETAEIAGTFMDPFLAYGIVKGAMNTSKLKKPVQLEEKIDPTRRDLLKTGAILTGGAIVYPTAKKLGLLETGVKAAKVGNAVRVATHQVVDNMPEFFPYLSELSFSKGKKIGEDYMRSGMTEFKREITIPLQLNTIEKGKTNVKFEFIHDPAEGNVTAYYTNPLTDEKHAFEFSTGKQGKQAYGVDPEYPNAWEYYAVEVEPPNFNYKAPTKSDPYRKDFDYYDTATEGDDVIKALDKWYKELPKAEKEKFEKKFITHSEYADEIPAASYTEEENYPIMEFMYPKKKND